MGYTSFPLKSPNKGLFSSILMLAFVAGFFNPSDALAEDPDPNYGYQRAPVKSQLVERVNDFSGAYTTSFPLIVPPGRNGLQPELELSYNSQARNNASTFGYGWSASVPFIERNNKKGSNKLYTENFYYSSLSGELEDISLSDGTHGTYGAKADDGSFLKYEYKTDNSWLVIDKMGTTYKFGTASSTRQDDPADSSRVFKWMLEEVRDTNDNFISYEYFKDAGQIYPSKIKYTGSGSTDGIFEIEFLRETRVDNLKSHNTGFAVTTNYRISEIQAKVSGTWTRKYALNYVAGDNGGRSLLDTITESGQDELSNVITLPVNTFDHQTKSPAYTYDSNWAIPVPFLTNVQTDSGTRIADVNGDALPDLLDGSYDSETGGGRSVYINNGSGWTEDTSWTLPMAFITIQNADSGARLADINGDGLPDFLYSGPDPSEPSVDISEVYLNIGSDWGSKDPNWTIPIPFIDNGPEDYGSRMADINGDGLVDIVYGAADSQNRTVYLHNGTGWTEDSNWSVPVAFITSTNSRDTGLRLGEVNGDGLIDLIYSPSTTNASSPAVYMNTGSDWVEDTSWSVPERFLTTNEKDNSVRLADVNSDGLVDIMYSGPDPSEPSEDISIVHINNGEAWVEDATWTLPEPFTSAGPNDYGTRMDDIDGDGSIDFIRSPYESNDRKVHFANDHVPDLIFHIDHSKGAEEDIAYKPSTAFSNPNLPFVLLTAESVVKDDGFGKLATTTYAYAGGEYWSDEVFNRKLAGFAQVTKTDPAGNVTDDFYHQGNATASSTGEFSDHVSKIGKVYRTEVADSSSNKYSQTIYKWENVDLGNDRGFVKLTQKIDFSYDGDGDHRDSAETYTYESTYGNLTQKVTWGEVTGSGDGTFTDTGSDKFTTDITYATNTTNYVVGLPSQETLKDQSNNKVKETKSYYDGLTLGNVDEGNLTKQEMWKSATTYVDIEKTYNSYGLVTQEKDPRDKTTTFTYDTNNLYPASVTNAKNHTTSSTYDYSSGKVKTKIDPNDRVFEILYDALDRSKEEKVPDLLTPTTLVTKSTTTYTDTGMPRKIRQTNYLTATSTFDVFTYLDGFERKIQERKEAETTNTYSVKDFVYNVLGLPEKESLPYFSTESANTSATSTSSLYNTFTYDALQRVKTSTNALGTTTNSYDQWETVVTDAEANQKDSHHDGYGRLVKVEEHNGAASYTTQYEYNGLGNLTKIIDDAGNVRNFTYDGLGRRLTAQDLHAPADGTFGTWTYIYDDAGNLTQTVDPKSQTINYTHDDINRVLTEDFTGQTGTEITYGYDTGTNGIGRLTTATTTDVVTNYAYNAVGGIDTETATIDSTNYATEYDYDRQGSTTLITYPDGAQVKYEYNTAGLLEKISKKEDGEGNFTNVVSNFDYAPTEKATFKEYQNETETTNTYDASKLYRLSNIYTTRTGEELGWGSGLLTLSPLSLLFAQMVHAQELQIDNPQGEGIPDATPARERFSPSGQSKSEENVFWNDGTPEGTTYTLEVSDTGIIKYEDPVGYITFTSSSLSWDNQQSKQANHPNYAKHAPGKYEFTDAFGSGISLNVSGYDRGVRKDITIDSLESLGEIPPSAKFLTVVFEVETSFDVASVEEIIDVVKLGEYSYLQVPKAWDSSESPDPQAREKTNDAHVSEKHVRVASRFYAQDGKLYFEKKVPVDWLQQATYPVYFDADITYGSFQQFYGGLVWSIEVEKLDTNKFVVCYADNDNTTRDTYCKVGTVSGSTISFGSPVTVDDDIWGPSLGACAIGTDKFAVVYPDDGLGDDGFVRIGTVSGSTITLGSAVEFSGNGNVENLACAGIDTDKLLISYDDLTASNTAKAVACTVSGTTPSCGTPEDFDTTDYDPEQISVSKLDTDKAVTCFESFDSGGEWCVVTTVSGTDLTHGSVAMVSGAANNVGTNDIGAWGTDQFVVAWNEYDSGWEGNAKVGTVSGTTITFGSEENYNGASAYNTTVTPHTSSKVVFGFSDAGSGWDGVSQYNTVNYGSRTLTATTTKDTFCSDSCGSEANESMDATLVDTDVLVICFDDADSTTEGQCVVGTLPTSGGGNSAPTAPTSLLTEGQTNPTDITDTTPEFSAIYNDPDSGDLATDYRLQVSTVSDFSSIFWDSTKSAFASSTVEGTHTEDISYAGSALASETTYYWRIKLWDDSDAEGAWSTATSTFSLASSPTVLQDITFTYDAIGNITKIVEASETAAARTVDYSYDDLYRLTSASSSTPYNETYSYDSIGNITSKSDIGTYLYEGDSGSNYANPHAVTSLASTTYTYDNNGNLTDDGTRTYTWDYRNKIASVTTASGTHTYAYNHEGQRVRSSNGSTTTVYANRLYNTDGSKVTKHIFDAEGNTIATVETEASTTQLFSVHPDHLTGSNVVTNEDGNLEQVIDYYPFGAIRLNEQSGSFDEQRKFTGQEYDDDTNLHYYVQRYYAQDIGKFVSQDPAYLAIGATELTEIVEHANQSIKDKTLQGLSGKEKDKQALQQFLSNPHQLNAYSYVTNNPLKYTDPQGEILGPAAVALIGYALGAYGGAQALIEGYETKTIFFDYPKSFTQEQKDEQKADIALTILTQGALKGVSETGKWVIEVGTLLFDAIDILNEQFDGQEIDNTNQNEPQTNQSQENTQQQRNNQDKDRKK